MSAAPPRRICVIPRVSGVGGMVSFRRKLVDGLARRGVAVSDRLDDDPPCQAVLLIGGTRDLPGLLRARRRGLRIVQRLDGMNWLHRRPGHGSGLRHYLRAEYGNFILRLIRARLASRVVYQSRFVQGWWQRVYGPTPAPARVIYNGVDLDVYTPVGPGAPPEDAWRILMVEGSLMGGYEHGLAAAVGLLTRLASDPPPGLPVELMIVGRAAEATRQYWEAHLRQQAPAGRARLAWVGQVAGERIPAIDRSAHLFYSSDIHPACPNAVIEALACGLPVLAFDTGALAELTPPTAGQVVPYGGDAWRLDPPDLDGLAQGARRILADLPAFRQGARRQAEAALGLEAMLDAYLDALLEG